MENLYSSDCESVLVIGNGFDLSLGLPTSYMDFIRSHEFQELLNAQNKLAIYLNNHAKLQNWIDIENELKNYSNSESNEDLKKEYEALCKQLTTYMNNIDNTQINRDSKAYEILTTLLSTKPILILDFNYTSSTKSILKQCNISDEEIDIRLIKVHGEASKDNIIFGIEDNGNIKKEHVFLRKAYNRKYKALNFQELFEDIKSLVFFGHSLGETDHTYFKTLFSNSCLYVRNNSASWNKRFTFYYYKDDGYCNMMQQLDSLTHYSLTKLRQYNNIKFEDTY